MDKQSVTPADPVQSVTPALPYLKMMLPELNSNQWKIVERVLAEVIGEDEPTPIMSYNHGNYPDEDAENRNQLRAEQRKRAGL